jgi:hypothetical protein
MATRDGERWPAERNSFGRLLGRGCLGRGEGLAPQDKAPDKRSGRQ